MDGQICKKNCLTSQNCTIDTSRVKNLENKVSNFFLVSMVTISKYIFLIFLSNTDAIFTLASEKLKNFFKLFYSRFKIFLVHDVVSHEPIESL